MVALNDMKLLVSEISESGEIPALDSRRVKSLNFVPYQRIPPVGAGNEAAYQEWVEVLMFIEADLHTVLCLPHDLFWCQVIFDDSLQHCISSYLQHAPRKFDLSTELKGDVNERLSRVHRLFFMVLLRMATHKESKESFLDPEVFGEIIYENFLFDIPKMLDMCVLYGKDNLQLVSKMITNLFTQQPKYWEDLKHTVHTIEQVLENILQECGISEHPDIDLPRTLATKPTADKRLTDMSDKALYDIVSYICDIGVTLSTFCEVFTPACNTLYDCGFLQKLCFFYDSVIADVQEALKSRQTEKPIRCQLHASKKHLISTFHQILQATCVTPILEPTSSSERAKTVDDYIDTLSHVIEYRRFIADYETFHPFDESIDLLTQADCDIDMTRITYIQDAINHAFATYGRRRKPTGHKHKGGRSSPDGQAGDVNTGSALTQISETGLSQDAVVNGYASDSETEGACAFSLSGIEVESMISGVKDLLPDYGDGFIEACLEQFGYDTDQVVNALLENKLPACLLNMDRLCERKPPKTSNKKKEKHSPTESSSSQSAAKQVEDYPIERRNIYDFDEFDVFHRDDIAFDRIHQGKRQMDPNDLDNKEFIKEMRPLYDFYSANDIASAYDRLDLYEDDYDDTYDDAAMDAGDNDSADELNVKRQNQVKKANNSRQVEDSSSDSETEEEKRKRSKNFLTDPAILRRQAEERRASKMGMRGGNNWKKPNPEINKQKATVAENISEAAENSSKSRVYDVKGKAKGQGQANDVLRNRQFKEQNKAKRGNHNRKMMADKKRSKGMVPMS